MSPTTPSKPLITLLTLPLLTNIVATLSTSTNLLTTSPFARLPSARLPSIFLITTMTLSVITTFFIINQSRHDRLLLLLFVVPLFTAALAMAVLLALLPLFNNQNPAMKASDILRWLLLFSAMPVAVGSLGWLSAGYVWLAFGAFQQKTRVESPQ